MTREGLLVTTSGWVWVVRPGESSVVELRVYGSWEALRRDFPRAPEQPSLIVEHWYETSWAEPGDRTLMTAVQRDVRV